MARNAKNTRMCSGCMARKDKSEFIAVARCEGRLSISESADAPKGRTAYICPSSACMEKAIKRKCFSRALRCEIPSGFYDDLREYFSSLNLE